VRQVRQRLARDLGAALGPESDDGAGRIFVGARAPESRHDGQADEEADPQHH
jgi:hypothetical protein